MRAQNEPPPTVVRHVRGDQSRTGPTTDIPSAYEVARVDEKALQRGEIWPQSRGSQLAGARRRLAGRRARPRPLRGARRQGDDARRRGDRGRGERGAGARAGGERRAGSARRTYASSTRTAARCRPSSPASTARSSTRRAPASACSRRAPTCAGASQPLPELQLELLRAAAERVRPGGTIVYSVCTINADESEAVVDASGLAVEPIEEWPQFRHPTPAGVPADAAARPPHERLLHRPAARRPRIVPWRGATGFGRSRSSRRSTRRTSRGSASRSSPCCTPAPASSTSTSATATSSRR